MLSFFICSARTCDVTDDDDEITVPRRSKRASDPSHETVEELAGGQKQLQPEPPQEIREEPLGPPAPRLVRCCLVLILVTLGAAFGFIALGVALMPPSLDMDFSSFMKTNSPASAQRDAYLAAQRQRAEGVNDRRLGVVMKCLHIVLTYELESAGSSAAPGLLAEDQLSQISSLERGLRSLREWEDLCKDTVSSTVDFCRLGISFTNYKFASRDAPDSSVVPNNLTLDGSARYGLPLQLALALVERDEVESFLFPKGSNAVRSSSTNMLRSIYRFCFLTADSSTSEAERRRNNLAIDDRWATFVRDVIIPYSRKHSSVGHAKVFYDGDRVASAQLSDALTNDLLLASISIVLVVLYMIFHTRSPGLGILGLIIILSAVPLAYVVSAVFTGNDTLNLASGLALFLIVGIGSDVVFVYSDFWNNSQEVARDDEARIKWTLRNAGRASLATAATTAASFFANLASSIKALRDFGFFMGLCVMLAWLLVSVVFLPACFLAERWVPTICRCSHSFSRVPVCAEPVNRLVAKGRAACKGMNVDCWVRGLTAIRHFCVLTFSLLVISAGITGTLLGSTTTFLPSIYPDHHNQVGVLRTNNEFEVWSQRLSAKSDPKAALVNTCQETAFQSSELQECGLFWCEVDTSQPDLASIYFSGMATSTTQPDISGAEECSCVRKSSHCSSSGQAVAKVTQRFAIADGEFFSLKGPLGSFIVNNSEGLAFDSSKDPDAHIESITKLPHIVIQDWYKGATEVTAVTQLVSSFVRSSSSSSCGWTDVCFCGVRSCNARDSSWRTVSGPRLIRQHLVTQSPPASRRLAQGSWKIRSDERAQVDVVFGLNLASSVTFLGKVDVEQSWSFNSAFVMRNPWTQRNMLRFCNELPDALRVSKKLCWIKEFEAWVLDNSLHFPVLERDFEARAANFIQNAVMDNKQMKLYVWSRNGELKASRMRFEIDVHYRAPAFEALEYKRLWDQYLERYNAYASNTAKGAIQTSTLWVQAEAVKELVSGTIITLVIALLFAFVGTLLVTRDLLLSVLVVLSTFSVVCLLMFFMAVIMSWHIGPIEIIALIAFLGYAMAYSLHIAHLFGSFELPSTGLQTSTTQLRAARVCVSLKTIGVAAVGSAITTILCAFPMLLCTLTIFTKLGGVIIVVTMLSIVTAVGPLSAALLLCGPLAPGFCMPRFYPHFLRPKPLPVVESAQSEQIPDQEEPEPELPRVMASL